MYVFAEVVILHASLLEQASDRCAGKALLPFVRKMQQSITGKRLTNPLSGLFCNGGKIIFVDVIGQ